MKVKRNVVARLYAEQIEACYTDPAPEGIGCPSTDTGDEAQLTAPTRTS